MDKLKTIAVSVMAFAGSLLASADDYIVVGKEAKVFDSPDATGYVTLNQKNQEVVLKPGMVFKALENAQGWYIIEYSPGLRGYISEQVIAAKSKMPSPGTYSVNNNPSLKVKVTEDGGKWSAAVGGGSFPGKTFGEAVVFFDAGKQPAYSIVDLGSGPVVMTYDNKTTKFF